MSKTIGDWFRTNYRNIIIVSLVVVPLLVSLISTIHVVNFFQLSNFTWLAVTLAIAFEIGALSSLAALAVMDKINKYSLWTIFILITVMQMMGNTYNAFDFITMKMKTNPEWTQNWIDLFSIQDGGLPTTKRILAIVSGAFLPIISLTFLHMLISYISKSRPSSEEYEQEYEYVTLDENGNEIVEEEYLESPDEKVNLKVVKPEIIEKEVKNEVNRLESPDEVIVNPASSRETTFVNFNDKQVEKIEEIQGMIAKGENPAERLINRTVEPVITEPSQIESPASDLIGNLIRGFKPNVTEDELVELKKQINPLVGVGPDGRPKIDLSSIFKVNMNTKPRITESKTTPLIHHQELVNFGPEITQTEQIEQSLNFGPDGNDTTYATQPEAAIPVNNDMQILQTPIAESAPIDTTPIEFVKDTAFEPIVVQSASGPGTDTPQPDLNDLKVEPELQKKRILLYKEKKN